MPFGKHIIAIEQTDLSYVPTVVYIDEQGCPECAKIRDFDIVDKLEQEGIIVIVYDIFRDTDMALAYNFTYGYGNKASSGVIFAGDQAFRGYEAIKQGFEQGLIQLAAQQPLLDVSGFDPDAIELFRGWRGVLEAVFIGLLDGFNPCEIAMLLMFISMIGFLKTKHIILIASISNISAIFLTYILLGIAYIFLLDFATGQLDWLQISLYSGFTLLALLLFGLTFHDMIITRQKKYDQIKAQMPNRFKKFNQKIMEKFTKVIHSEKRDKKFYITLVFIPFIVGIVVALVEAICTSTPYLFFLSRIQAHYTQGSGISMYEVSLLVIFNIMFVMPLIVITFIAVVTQSIHGVSDFIRRHLPLKQLKLKQLCISKFLDMHLFQLKQRLH